jgi:lysophospholipase L1-like esterase
VDDQLSALDRARLVTLTVGAANLGLSAVLAACLPTSDQCGIEIARAQSVLGDCPGGKSLLGDSLTALYAQVASKARGARIVVTGYPLLFEPPDPNAPNAGIITVINQATTDLNCVIERAVAATQATYANIHYVDVTEEFAGHGIGCTAPCTLFINPPLSAPPGAEAFHPTADGYAAYAKAIKTKLPDGWLDKQDRLV